MRLHVFLYLLISTLLVGCQTPTHQQTGAVLGGAVGGIAGNQLVKDEHKTAATIGGALVGAFVGGYIGQQFDSNDNENIQKTLETTPDQQETTWKNPDTGHTYMVKPTRTYQIASGTCREYETEAIINNKREIIRGTACRHPDGIWRVSGN